MKKISLFLLLSVILISPVLISCSPSAALTADQIVQKMAENSKNLKTGEITLDMEMSIGGSSIKIDSTGVFENPDKSLMTMNMMGSTVQVLVLSPDEIYTRQGESGKWTRSPNAAETQTGSLYDFTKNPELLLKYYQNAKLLPEKSTPACTAACYHVSFELDVAELFKASGAMQSSLQNVKFNAPADVELWIDKTDFFTRRQESSFDMNVNNQDVEVKVVITQSGINQPVTIPSP